LIVLRHTCLQKGQAPPNARRQINIKYADAFIASVRVDNQAAGCKPRRPSKCQRPPVKQSRTTGVKTIKRNDIVHRQIGRHAIKCLAAACRGNGATGQVCIRCGVAKAIGRMSGIRCPGVARRIVRRAPARGRFGRMGMIGQLRCRQLLLVVPATLPPTVLRKPRPSTRPDGRTPSQIGQSERRSPIAAKRGPQKRKQG
jgi:hypothetical protein